MKKEEEKRELKKKKKKINGKTLNKKIKNCFIQNGINIRKIKKIDIEWKNFRKINIQNLLKKMDQI